MSAAETFLDGRVTLHVGDCLAMAAEGPEGRKRALAKARGDVAPPDDLPMFAALREGKQ